MNSKTIFYNVKIIFSFILTMLLMACCKHEINSGHLKIATCNLNYENTKPNELTDAILKQNCDFYSCIEWTSKNLNKEKIINAGYKFILDYPKTGTHGICMFVKTDIKAIAKIEMSPLRGPCAIPIGIARIKIQNKNISIFGIHAPPPIPACKNTTEGTLVEIAKWFKDGIVIKDIGISKENDDAILLGDFNAISNSKGISAILNSGFNDTHKKMSFFPAATWSPTSWLFAVLRIDYIFTGKAMKPLYVCNFKLPNSDHKGIFTVTNW